MHKFISNSLHYSSLVYNMQYLDVRTSLMQKNGRCCSPLFPYPEYYNFYAKEIGKLHPHPCAFSLLGISHTQLQQRFEIREELFCVIPSPIIIFTAFYVSQTQRKSPKHGLARRGERQPMNVVMALDVDQSCAFPSLWRFLPPLHTSPADGNTVIDFLL